MVELIEYKEMKKEPFIGKSETEQELMFQAKVSDIYDCIEILFVFLKRLEYGDKNPPSLYLLMRSLYGTIWKSIGDIDWLRIVYFTPSQSIYDSRPGENTGQ